MAKIFPEITDHHGEWIARQAMFFVATAPLAEEGHVNVSPKGPIGSLAVLDPHTVAYLDVNGSGTETIAHLRENARICVMLCAFEGPPRILRLHGRGEVVLKDDAGFDDLLASADFADASIPEARRAVMPGRGEPDRGLMRLRSTADELRGTARPPRALEHQEASNSGCCRLRGAPTHPWRS